MTSTFLSTRTGPRLEVPSVREPVCSQPLFIFGSPRSGTTYLVEILNHHSKILLTNELRMMSFYAHTIASAVEARHQIHNADLRAGFIAHLKQQVRPTIEEYYRCLAVERMKSPIVFGDKNPGYADPALSPGCLEFILETFPHAQFIHIRRDPLRVVRSLVGKKWMGLDAAVDIWARITRRGRELQASLPEAQYLEITHEELSADASAVVPRVLDFLHLEMEPGLIEYLKAEAQDRTPYSDPIALPGDQAKFDLSPQQEERLHHLLGDALDDVDRTLEHYRRAHKSDASLSAIESDAASGEFVAIPDESLLGELEIRLLSYALTINSASVKSGSPVRAGDHLTLRVRAAALRGFAHTVFGISISNELSRVVATGNNASSALKVFGLDAGVATLELSFDWPDLGPGTYSVTVGLGEGADGDHNIVQCWADSCFTLRQVVAGGSAAVARVTVRSASRL